MIDLEKIYKSGQTFLWDKVVDKRGNVCYLVRNAGSWALVQQDGENYSISMASFCEESWQEYFDDYTDYETIVGAFRQKGIVDDAVKAGAGLRILRQTPWEAAVQFVISQNNNIPRIKKCVDALARRFNGEIEVFGERYAACLPKPWQIVKAGPGALEGLGLGYRAKYLFNLAVNWEKIIAQIWAEDSTVSFLGGEELPGNQRKIFGERLSMNRKDRRKQKQKNVGELPSGTQEEAYITENRAQAGQIITLCAMIAAYDLFDTPADAWEQMGDALQKVGAEYKAVALRHGIRAADQWLAQQTADSMGKYIRDQWPIPRAAKNDRERLAFDAQRDGINYSLRLFVLCARQFFDWARDTGKMQQLLEETRGNYQQFLDEAALGDSYGHALLDRKVREMTGGEEHIGTDYNKQPIFGKTLY